MKTSTRLCMCVFLLSSFAAAVSKQHVVAFGKWTTVKWMMGKDEDISMDLRIRPLFVDGRTKEFTTGPAHDVTDRMFVVQRVYRLNDLLPQETGPNRWRWERGGWLVVDRISGRVQPVLLPAFDAYYSEVSWFRDYAAYCGVSDDGEKVFTVVAQLGKRRPLLKKAAGESGGDPQGKPCHVPTWLRAPARVTFEARGTKVYFCGEEPRTGHRHRR